MPNPDGSPRLTGPGALQALRVGLGLDPKASEQDVVDAVKKLVGRKWKKAKPAGEEAEEPESGDDEE